MLTLGLLPLVTWAIASQVLTTRLLGLRTAQLDALLSRVDEELDAGSADRRCARRWRRRGLNLVQAELARRLAGAPDAAAARLHAARLGRRSSVSRRS